jgi:hypothetical protein
MSEFEGKAEDFYSGRVFRILTQTGSEPYRGAFLKSFVGVGAIAVFGV